ncbi:MAG: hypothetical protein WBQ23_10380 [Bacteroidota bacterium]
MPVYGELPPETPTVTVEFPPKQRIGVELVVTVMALTVTDVGQLTLWIPSLTVAVKV